MNTKGHLVLTRRPNEGIEITVGDEVIIVDIVEIKGNQVRMKFTADHDVTIHRTEIADRIRAETNG